MLNLSPSKIALIASLFTLGPVSSTHSFAQTAPAANPGEVLLLASYSMQPDPVDPKKVVDSGPLHLDGKIVRAGVTYGEGRTGKGLHFDGTDAKVIVKPTGLIDLVRNSLTITAWVKLDGLPPHGRWAAIVTKRVIGGSNPFSLGIGDAGGLGWQSYNGVKWQNFNTTGKLKVGVWEHVAATYQNGGEAILWLNGKPVGRQSVEIPMMRTTDPLVFGWDPSGGASLNGTLDDVHLYATALDASEVNADMAGTLTATRAASPADFPALGYPVCMALGRFDQPLAFRSYDGRRLHDAVRSPGPDAVDWPILKLNGDKSLFQHGPVEMVDEKLLSMPEAKDLFRTAKDNSIDPINHWFRVNKWLFNRNFVYTTDRTARTSGGEYELWTFPVKISGAGNADIESIELRLAGNVIYERNEKLRSLTLLLPANLNGAPYELTVNGRGPVKFDVGLLPVSLGRPQDEPIKVDTIIPGSNPAITVASLDRPSTFANQKEWDADLAALANGSAFVAPTIDPRTGFGRYLGLSVPRSPIEVFTTFMLAGMGGGHRFGSPHIAAFVGTPEQYAADLEANGYDFVFDDAKPKSLDEGTEFDEWLAAMARHGLRAGAVPDLPGSLGILGNPNMAFQSCYLPEWGAPAYRDAQLLIQRFGRYASFLGLLIGADNAGYVPYWDWAATNPDRPWGRAYLQFQQGREPITPVGPELHAEKSYERKGTQREFVDYIHRYDETFKRYGYFARAVQDANPDAILTTASFGSSPGGGARGGWPWATIPGKPMFENLPIQTAYDWNELSSSKPLHNLALVDRLQSYFPTKPTWALIDDFAFLFGREARQRAYALALTRGVKAVGTTFLAHETGDQSEMSGQLKRFKETPRARPEVIAEQKELYAWIHKHAGAYVNAKPLASIGILYVHEQGISRMIVPVENDKTKEIDLGSHEGKTTEALFLCHMAGWPAKIITPEELQRGLPQEMKAVLLVGLNRFDNSWNWYDGLEADLKNFTARGGRLILDRESIVPDGLTATKTGMQIAAYTTQSMMDVSPVLLSRNHDNAALLRAAMEGISEPIAVSAAEDIWAVPHQAGDVQYVTAINWGSIEGQNASRVVKPQTGKFIWNTNRPIYDVQAGRRITPAEAQTVDLTKDAFHLYALPPAAISAPGITVARGTDGFWMATVDVGARGVPVQVVVSKGTETATLSGASGNPIRLPIGPTDSGACHLSATELLSLQTGRADFSATEVPMIAAHASEAAMERFAARKAVPLIVALTPAQAADPAMVAQAGKIASFYIGKGRNVQISQVAPNDVVRSLQPLKPIQHYPQWTTVEADLVLFGSPSNNVLILDQARSGLLTRQSGACITYSPFVGEYDALNILSPDLASVSASVQQIVAR